MALLKKEISKFTIRTLIVGLSLLNVMWTFPALAQEKNSHPKYDKLLTGYEYPLPTHSYKFQSQGKNLTMNYMYLAPKDANLPVITLLHGKNFNGAYWQQTAEYIHDLGYGVLIPDQIGFGKSSKPVDYQFSFEALANNTHSLLESLNINSSIIVGHSMGGMLAARYSLLYPQSTKQLILINPIGLENYLQFVEYKDLNFFYENELKLTPEKIVSYQKQNYYDGAWNDRYAALAEPLIGWINGPDRDILATISARTYDMIFTGAVVDDFSKLEVPATLIIGTRDRTGPGRNWKKDGITRELGRYDRLGKEITDRNSNIKVIELDGLGHLPQIEDFARFKNIFTQTLTNQ